MSIFKEQLSPIIKEQLYQRGDSFKNRSSKDITYINSRNAWIRMSSGVNINGDSSIALQNILQGGILNNNNLKYGLGNSTNAYSNINNSGEKYLTGINPTPGITNVSIKSLGAYGSLREAIIEFICYDIKQLEILEMLYMRPGFSVLLEWGWIPYLDNNGNLVNNISFYNDIFLNSNLSFNERCSVLYKKSLEETNGNYDAILGYVKNYNWENDNNGNYRCTINLISLGEIIESLKINYSNFVGTEEQTDKFILYPKIANRNNFLFTVDNSVISTNQILNSYTNKERNIRDVYSRSILAGLFSELYLIAESNAAIENKGRSFLIEDLSGNLTGEKNYIVSMFVWDIDTSSSNKKTNKQDYQVYIDLDSFCKIITKNILLVNKNKSDDLSLIELSVKDREYLGLNNNLLCLADPLQISVNPLTCLIKNSNWGNALKNIPSIKETEKYSVQNILPTNNIDYIQAKTTVLKYLLNPQQNFNQINSYLLNNINNTTNIENQNQYKKYFSILEGVWEDYKIKNITIGNDTIYLNFPNKNGILGDVSILRSKNVNDIKNITFLDVLYKYNFNQINSLLNQVYPNQNRIYYNSIITPDTLIKDQSNNIINEIVGINNVLIQTQNIVNESNKNLLPLDNLYKDYFYKDENNIVRYDLGNIGGIYLNVGFIINSILNNVLENQDFKEKNEINLYDYIKNIMVEVQSSIGNINNFDIFVDPIDNKVRIVDINYVTDKQNEKVFEETFTFMTNRNNQFDGLFNNIRRYRLNSRIFKEQSTIVAISAQNGGGELGLDNTTLVGWNKGLTDRVKPDIGVPNIPSYTNEKTLLLNNISDSCVVLADFFNDLSYKTNNGFFSFFSYRNREIKLDRIDEYKSALRDIISTLKALTNSNIKFKAIIPTVLSIDMDGIGGLVIGNIFKFPELLLPKGYKGEDGIGRKLGFIITSINHNLQNNDWETTIDAQTVILESPQEGINYNTINIIPKSINNSLNPENNKIKVNNQQQNMNITNSNNINTIYNYVNNKLIEENYQGDKHLHISALLGVLMLESTPNINPNALNQRSGAYGIAQWLGVRKDELFKKYGKNPTLNQQLDFMWQELNTTEKTAKNRWLNSNTLTESVYGFAFYERAEEFNNGVLNKNHPNIITRINYANKIYNSNLS